MQMVEIAKALSQIFKIIVMDEPKCSDSETESLFEVIRELTKRKALIYLSGLKIQKYVMILQ